MGMLSATCGLGLLAPPPVHAPPPPQLAPPTSGGLTHYDPYNAPHHATSEHFALRWGNGASPTLAQQEAVLDQLEEAWDAGVDTLAMEPPTGSATSYVNVYLGGTGPDLPPISFVGGYVTPDLSNVPFMVLHPDLLVNVGGYEDALDGILVHEFFHVLQFSLDSFTGGFGPFAATEQVWFWESTASWFAHDTLPGNAWVPSVFGAYLLTPHLAVDLYDPYAKGLVSGRIYHSALFHRYLSEHVADPTLISDAWLTAGQNADPLTVLDSLLQGHGTSLDEAFPGFATHNAVLDYDEGEAYGTWADTWVGTYSAVDQRLLDTLDATALPATLHADALAPRAWGYSIVELTDIAPAGWDLSVDGEPGSAGSAAAFHLAWVTVDAKGQATHGELAGPGEDLDGRLVPPADAVAAYIAVTSQPTGADPTEAFDFTLTVAEVPEPIDTSTTGHTAATADTGIVSDTSPPTDTVAAPTADTALVDTGTTPGDSRPSTTGPGDTATASTPSSPTTTTSAPGASDDGSGCGCTQAPARVGWLALLGVWLRRREDR